MSVTFPEPHRYGMAVITSPVAKRGEVYMVSPNGRHGKIVMHWIDVSMLSFDPDLWWSETPSQTARRIVNEVLEHHGFEPLPSTSEQPSGASDG